MTDIVRLTQDSVLANTAVSVNNLQSLTWHTVSINHSESSQPPSTPPGGSLFRQVYERGTNVEQFVTRFLLKESANQIQSLLNSVESAVDAIDEQHSSVGSYPSKTSPRVPDRRYETPVPDYPPNNRVTSKDSMRNINTGAGAVEVRKEGLETQINRLAELIGRLENKTVWFDLHQRLTDTDGTSSASLYLIRQEMKVSQKQLGDFCEALKQYLKNVSAQRDCFQHVQTAACKAFQHVKVDTLCQPEAVSAVAVPGAFHCCQP
ncbi:N-terminal EF-hand calcium-binding protein 2-like [Sinocyclocheilus rhinocerous]|uniref:N-terminal EF-hand calcium-binding protein 2-like n=1 Tax=Sinocyclocheilus rhinocerous TaxID=307959 RepID=UPI0007BA717A|nr:PREDICTED: N-terminal EF-hand calcium-binding protein 2-like [Sinocyclocheilus rhinocerous]